MNAYPIATLAPDPHQPELDLRPATDEEKLAYLNAISHGFTRGLFRDVPLDELPLYHNGHDFYMLTGVKRKQSE